MMAGGILKNKIEADQDVPKLAESTKEFRNKVLENTKLNALLKDPSITAKILNESGEFDPSKISQLTPQEQEKLKWNAENLESNSRLQKQIMESIGDDTIDEPKTPFQAATDPALNEYYQDDDLDDLNDFKLGEAEFKVDELDEKSGGPVTGELEEGEEEEPPQHSKPSFDELRKKHYHHEHIPSFTKDVDEEADLSQERDFGDEDEDEEEEPKPKKSFAELRKSHYQDEHKPVLTNDDEDDE